MSQANKHKKMQFLDLYPKYRIQVLKFLEVPTLLRTVQAVCKTLQRDVQNNDLWSALKCFTIEEEKLRREYTQETLMIITKLIYKCPNLRRVKITAPNCFDKIKPVFFNSLAELKDLNTFILRGFLLREYCRVSMVEFFHSVSKNLKCLDLYMSVVECYETLEEIPVLLTSLTKFVAPESPYEVYEIYEDILRNCEQLEYFDISYQNFLDEPRATLDLTLGYKTLKTLIIMENSLEYEFYRGVERCDDIKVLKIDCTHLSKSTIHKFIDFKLNELYLSNVLLDEAEFTYFLCAAKLKHLTHLSLDVCRALDDDSLRIISIQCVHLTSLLLKRLHKVTQYGLCKIVCSCSKLTTLKLDHLSEVGGYFLQGIKMYLPLLTVLHLNQLRRITMFELRMFIEHNPEFEIIEINRTYATGFDTEPTVNPNFKNLLYLDGRSIGFLQIMGVIE